MLNLNPYPLHPDWEIAQDRSDDARGRFALLADMRVERGTKADWDALHALHYKAQSLPAGAHFWRCVTAEGDLVGICVLSSVALLLRSRHELFPQLKPGGDTKFTNVYRAVWLNKNFRRAARIVTDTLYRGVGVSYRMVNLAMRLEGFRFVEIQSSMSKFNPFDIKAGFRHANLHPATAHAKGVAFLQRYFVAFPGDYVAILEEYDAMSPGMQASVGAAIRAFYYRNSAKEKTASNLHAGTANVDAMPIRQLLRELQQLIFASPVYGIWENPDLGRELPDQLPLAAYDWQSPIEPLRLDRL